MKLVLALLISGLLFCAVNGQDHNDTQWPLLPPGLMENNTSGHVLLPGAPNPVNADAYCFQCMQRRNHKDAYPDPQGNCHSFYKCQYLNESHAIGIKLACPVGTYWHDEILACMPEGATPCSDVCQDPSVAANGCYGQDGNCASFFVCSETASYALCCPPLTSFNSATCQCDDNPQCTDQCIISAPLPTTEAPPRNFGTFCIDSFNNQIKQTDDPTIFQIFNDDSTYNLYCARGTVFNIDTCRCEGEVVPVTEPQNRQCSVYLPFDADTKDNSLNEFWTDLIQPGVVDNTVYAQGSGSLRLDGGHLEIPGTKSLDFGQTIGICLFYRCNSASCVGGLLSNNRNDANYELSVIIAALGFDSLILWGDTADAGVSNSGPISFDTSTNSAQGFTQVCGSYNGTSGSIYINNQLLASFPVKPEFAFAHCPITVGSDPQYGDYIGYLDEVLICPNALAASDVDAHWNGRASLAAVGLVPA